jgi:hypothetical protein
MVVGREGASATVRVPAGFVPLAFSQASIVGISRDSLGVETVGRIALPALLP